MTETITLPDSVTTALRILKGEPVERGLYELVRRELARRIQDNEARISSLGNRYGEKKRLEEKILGQTHTWKEEKDLFDWDGLVTENAKLKKLLAAIPA